MRTRNRRITAFAAVAILGLSGAACSDEDGDGEGGDEELEQLEEGVEDGANEVEEQVEEGAEESGEAEE